MTIEERGVSDERTETGHGAGLIQPGLGSYEAAAPGRLSRFLGLEVREQLLRSYGVREITAGLNIFRHKSNPAHWIRKSIRQNELYTTTLS